MLKKIKVYSKEDYDGLLICRITSYFIEEFSARGRHKEKHLEEQELKKNGMERKYSLCSTDPVELPLKAVWSKIHAVFIQFYLQGNGEWVALVTMERRDRITHDKVI